MATLNSFIRFYIVYSDIAQQYTQNSWLRFHGNNGYVNAPHYYIIHCLFCSLFHSFLVAFFTSFFPYFLLLSVSSVFLIYVTLPLCPVQIQTIAGQTAWTEHEKCMLAANYNTDRMYIILAYVTVSNNSTTDNCNTMTLL
jgi:hypothetical protein